MATSQTTSEGRGGAAGAPGGPTPTPGAEKARANDAKAEAPETADVKEAQGTGEKAPGDEGSEDEAADGQALGPEGPEGKADTEEPAEGAGPEKAARPGKGGAQAAGAPLTAGGKAGLGDGGGDGGAAKLASFKSGAAKVGKKLTTKTPAKAHVSQMQGAAIGPANEKDSGGKAAQVGDMDAAPPGTFDKASFIAAVEAEIAKNAPKNLEEADDMSGSGKMGKVKEAVNSKVGDSKDQAAEKVQGETEKPPDPSRGEEKQVAPMPGEPAVKTPGSVGAANAMPDPRSPAETDLSAPKGEVDQQMAADGVTEEQLADSEEPEFIGALGAKKAGDKHSATAAGPVKQDEQAILGQAKSSASGVEKQGLMDMGGARKSADGAVAKAKGGSKGKDEAARKKVADRIEQIYTKTQADATQILTGLDKKVDAEFTKGEAAARQKFETKHKKDFQAWKDKRYSGWGSSLKWAKDKLFGVPAEANKIFDKARTIYVAEMKGVIASVADLVSNELTAAKTRIAEGRTEIVEYVASLPKDLKSVGTELAEDVQSKFDALDADVESKQSELVQAVAGKYKEAQSAVDAKIDELKAANSGLWNKAKAAIAAVINTIRQLKNAIMTALKGAADAISLIIKSPKKFLTNLIDAVKNGLNSFKDNIADHLQTGFFGWLTGAMGGAGITMPQSFDLKGIIGLVLQIIGATWANIRAKIVKRLKTKFGPKAEAVIGKVESGVAIISALVSEGPIALWKIISEKVGNLWDLVVGKLKEFLITKVITAGITWIIGILNPVAGFIKICKAIVDIVMWFWNNASRISELVTTIAGSVKAIAQGSIGAASKAVENVLVKMLPLAIGFLASLLGLGGISKKIKSVVKAVQRPITKVINKVVDKAVGLGKKFLGKLSGDSQTPDEKKDRLERGVTAGVSAVNGLPGSRLPKRALDAVLRVIKVRHRMTDLRAVRQGNRWTVTGKVNPSKTMGTAKEAPSEDLAATTQAILDETESTFATQLANDTELFDEFTTIRRTENLAIRSRRARSFRQKVSKRTSEQRDPLDLKYPNPTVRPSLPMSTCRAVWNAAKDPSGHAQCPTTGATLSWPNFGSNPRGWTMGHVPGREYRYLWRAYSEGRIGESEFLRHYRDPDNYRPEALHGPRGHELGASTYPFDS